MRQKYISQKQSNQATIRLRVPVGIVYPEQLEVIMKVAHLYGKERIHLTARKTVEIPGIAIGEIKKATEELAAAGLHTTPLEENIRNVVACPGLYCTNSRIDAHSLGLEIDTNIICEDTLPAKVKIAIAGCTNACSHPQINDIGFIGVSKVHIDEEECEHCSRCINECLEGAIIKNDDGKVIVDKEKCVDCGECSKTCKAIKVDNNCFRIMVGGKLGKHPRFANVLGDLPSIADALNKIELILLVYKQHGLPNERLGTMIDRIGFERFVKLIL